MAVDIPACGIKAYMEGEVRKHLPSNGWWRFLKKIENSQKWLVLLGTLLALGLMVLDYQRGTTILAGHGDTAPFIVSVFVDAVFVVGFGGYALWILGNIPAKAPGVWRRYALKDFTKKYGPWCFPGIAAAIAQIRRSNYMAEFEFAVLERPFPDPQNPEYFGLVLFQTTDRAGQIPTAFRDGLPLCICDSAGHQLQFDEGYTPSGSFGTALGPLAKA